MHLAKVLFSALLLLVMLHGMAQAQDITTNLLAHWPMNHASGTTATDVQGGFNGTLRNSTAWVTPGKVGSNAVDLTPASSDIFTTDIAAIGGASALTVATWVYLPALAGFRAFVAQLNYAGAYTNTAFSLGHNDSNTTWGLSTNGTTVVSCNGAILSANVWTHVAGTYDGANLKLYVNGTLVNTVAQTGTVFNSTLNVTLGSEQVNGLASDFVIGYLDDVRIYTRALTLLDVQALVDLGGAAAAVARRRPLFLE